MIKELEKRTTDQYVSMKTLNILFKKHPEEFTHPAFDQIVTLYHPYNKWGHLPFPGSVSEQPAQIMDFFSIIDNLNHERELKEVRSQEREIERKRIRGN